MLLFVFAGKIKIKDTHKTFFTVVGALLSFAVPSFFFPIFLSVYICYIRMCVLCVCIQISRPFVLFLSIKRWTTK